MGVQPIKPGFAKVRIKPQVGSLTSGSLDLPTVRGTIHMDFASASDKSFVLNVTLPTNIEAIVYLPRLDSGKRDVIVDGRVVQGAFDGKSVVLDNIGAGKHRFERLR